MREPNDQLVAARGRIASPNATGESLTRRELADLVNELVFHQTGKRDFIDANYVGKLEQGVIRWIQDNHRRAAFRTILGVSSDAELGLRRPRRSRPTVADVERKQFIRAAIGVTAGAAFGRSALAELFEPTQRTPVPSVIGLDAVAEVRNAAIAFSNWDAQYGAGIVREAVTEQLRFCTELLNARCSPAVRAELFSAVGYLGHVSAFMAFDSYAHDDAQKMFKFALRCAEEAGDWHLRAKILSSMARQAIWRGDPDTGLTYTELAMVRSDRLTGTEMAMLHTARARALAKLGRVQETAAAVGAADEAFARARSHNDPPWMSYYDAAQHNGDTGHALWDTAMHGHFVTEARHRLALAATGHDDGHGRSRAISQTKLASLTMVTGDPIEAATFGGQALDWAGAIRSRRTADDLRELRKLALPHERKTEVAELTSRIGAVIVA